MCIRDREQVAKHASFSLGKQLIRQMMPRFDALWVRRELARVKAVSYTHLDVYKRQLKNSRGIKVFKNL